MRTKEIPKGNLEKINELAEFIHQLRINEGYTQDELADGIKTHRNTISNIERAHNFGVIQLFEIADFFNISVSAFFDD
jgi:transcriptional regulator with XRE-family HTH domain